jgi:orotate phosphoribosyltransferase
MASSPTAEPSNDPVLAVFLQTGAYLRGHFRLTSGLHSPEYLQCAKVLQHPAHAEAFGRALADRIRALAGPGSIPVVASPAVGGLIIVHEAARALGARFVFTERDADGKMTLRRGFAIEPGERAAVVEDVVTTGGSTREVVELLRAHGAEVLAAGSVIDRSGGLAQVGVPRAALATLTVTAYDPAECPLCAAGEPVVKPGSRPTANG